MVIRDLRVYAQVDRGTVLHYRDKARLEEDTVVESDDGARSISVINAMRVQTDAPVKRRGPMVIVNAMRVQADAPCEIVTGHHPA